MVLLILGLIAILLLEVPGLVKQKMWRELAVFMGIFSIGAFYSIVQVMRLEILNPTVILEFIYGPIAETIDVLLTPRE